MAEDYLNGDRGGGAKPGEEFVIIKGRTEDSPVGGRGTLPYYSVYKKSGNAEDGWVWEIISHDYTSDENAGMAITEHMGGSVVGRYENLEAMKKDTTKFGETTSILDIEDGKKVVTEEWGIGTKGLEHSDLEGKTAEEIFNILQERGAIPDKDEDDNPVVFDDDWAKDIENMPIFEGVSEEDRLAEEAKIAEDAYGLGQTITGAEDAYGLTETRAGEDYETLAGTEGITFNFRGKEFTIGGRKGTLQEDYETAEREFTEDYQTLAGYDANGDGIISESERGTLQEDYDTETTRLGEDYTTTTGRALEDYELLMGGWIDTDGDGIDDTYKPGTLEEDYERVETRGDKDIKTSKERLGLDLGAAGAGARSDIYGLQAGGAQQRRASMFGKGMGGDSLAIGDISRSIQEQGGTMARNLRTKTRGLKEGATDIQLGITRGIEDALRTKTRGEGIATSAYDRTTETALRTKERGEETAFTTKTRAEDIALRDKDRGIFGAETTRDRGLDTALTDKDRAVEDAAILRDKSFSDAYSGLYGTIDTDGDGIPDTYATEEGEGVGGIYGSGGKKATGEYGLLDTAQSDWEADMLFWLEQNALN